MSATLNVVTIFLRRWIFPFSVLLATCFGVFVLPFLLPPPVIQGVSIANAAGFNNKVAAVAAALMSITVLLFQLRQSSGLRYFLRPRELLRLRSGSIEDQHLAHADQRLSVSVIASVVAVVLAVYGLLSWLIVISHQRYMGDAGYFIEQISAHADYGRRLYDQIEFPYGPLLFYAPIIVRGILAPLHLSLTGAYFITLLTAQCAGLSIIAYTLNRLPIVHRWKLLLLVLCAPLAIELDFGLNYTFFRFAASTALLVWASGRRRPESTAGALLIGQCVSLGISPEMGFAYLAGGLMYAGYMLLIEGRRWRLAVAALPSAVVLFLLVAGGGYLRMLGLFARGLFNFIVEPLPHILVFLFALVWLVPMALAAFLKERRPETPILAGLYVSGMALLPVAFGRADPGHVTFNGLGILFLSVTAMGQYRRRWQSAWAVALSLLMLWTAYINTRPFQMDLRGVIHYDVLHYGGPGLQQAALRITQKLSPAAAQRYMHVKFPEDEPFDIAGLQQIIGHDRIATPEGIPLVVEQALKTSGQYIPQFYCFGVAALDASAEDREIAEMNQAKWALIHRDADPDMTETQAAMAPYLGFALPYRMKREPYTVGLRFRANLQQAWRPYASLGDYEIYQRR